MKAPKITEIVEGMEYTGVPRKAYAEQYGDIVIQDELHTSRGVDEGRVVVGDCNSCFYGSFRLIAYDGTHAVWMLVPDSLSFFGKEDK